MNAPRCDESAVSFSGLGEDPHASGGTGVQALLFIDFVSRLLAPRVAVGHARCGVSKHQGAETWKVSHFLISRLLRYLGWKKGSFKFR